MNDVITVRPDLFLTADVRAAIEAAYASRNVGDLGSFCALLHDDVILEQPASLPFGGTFTGTGAVRAALQQADATWKSIHYDLERVTVGENIAIAYLHVRLETHGGLAYGFQVAELLRFVDGKVIKLRPFNFDTHRLRQIAG